MTALPRLMISAAHKSSGKTVITTGLAAALRDAGTEIGTFKKGPDYIDPMWLAAATGRPCYNLDFNTMEPDAIVAFFQSRAQAHEVSLIEANKGLFDGVNPDGSDANAELAKLLGLPVILVIDTIGMTRGIAPLLLGYRNFDPQVTLAGVILNKVGGSRHEGKLRRAVETYTDLLVLGAVWRQPGLEIGERHLGLTTPAECDEQAQMIDRFAAVVRGAVDLETLRRIASGAPGMAPKSPVQGRAGQRGQGLRIGLARDAAFGFYYPDDLEAFEAEGATLIPIDMIHDRQLPDIDGIFIGGGFPEMQMKDLSANVEIRKALSTALAAGLPCYAECGGLMYLCQSLTFRGETWPMVGAIDGDAVMHGLPQGRGYVSFTTTPAHPWGAPESAQMAHEFHYASIKNLPPDSDYGRRMIRGAGIGDGQDAVVKGAIVAGFCHLRNTGPAPWVPRFLDFVRRCKLSAPGKNPAG